MQQRRQVSSTIPEPAQLDRDSCTPTGVTPCGWPLRTNRSHLDQGADAAARWQMRKPPARRCRPGRPWCSHAIARARRQIAGREKQQPAPGVPLESWDQRRGSARPDLGDRRAARDLAVDAVRRHVGTGIDAVRGLLFPSGRLLGGCTHPMRVSGEEGVALCGGSQPCSRVTTGMRCSATDVRRSLNAPQARARSERLGRPGWRQSGSYRPADDGLRVVTGVSTARSVPSRRW